MPRRVMDVTKRVRSVWLLRFEQGRPVLEAVAQQRSHRPGAAPRARRLQLQWPKAGGEAARARGASEALLQAWRAELPPRALAGLTARSAVLVRCRARVRGARASAPSPTGARRFPGVGAMSWRSSSTARPASGAGRQALQRRASGCRAAERRPRALGPRCWLRPAAQLHPCCGETTTSGHTAQRAGTRNPAALQQRPHGALPVETVLSHILP
jgi:hypothetical protein